MKDNQYKQVRRLFTITPTLFLGGILFISFLLSGCGKKNEDQHRAERRKQTKTALTIIRNDDCLNCHSIEDRSVGPAYLEIARKYESDFSIVNRLAKKIIEGGGGLWGGEQMSKHPLLKSSDARRIVRWILSLDDPKANPDPMVEVPGVSLSEAFGQQPTESENGLVVQAYPLENARSSDFFKISSTLTPQQSGVIKTVHFPQPEAFEPLPPNVVLQITGFITLAHSGKYFFKQERLGKGRVFLNGDLIISENDWDREIDVDLSPGTYPITVEYLAESEERRLSLQWITPEGEYYRVIPEEAFSVSLSQTKAAQNTIQ
jgi:cytochrome c